MFITKLVRDSLREISSRLIYTPLNKFSNLKDRFNDLSAKNHINLKNLYQDLRSF